MSSFIHIQGVSKTFKEKEILKDVTFSLKKGEILSLVGASGSGKSTFLRILAGLESATKGKVLIDGNDISSTKPQNRPIGMVFQQPLLFPHMNVLENVMYGLEMRGKKKRENKRKAKDYIQRVGLGEVMHHYPSELIGGPAATGFPYPLPHSETEAVTLGRTFQQSRSAAEERVEAMGMERI